MSSQQQIAHSNNRLTIDHIDTLLIWLLYGYIPYTLGQTLRKSMMATPSNVKKVTFNLPNDQVEFLQRVSAQEGVSVTDVLRRAINAEKFFIDQEKAGCKVLIEDSTHRMMQVIRR
jgi:hypothetical protein